jgi:HEAT repeat protein
VANDSVIDRLTALAQADESRLRDAAAWAIARVALTRHSAKAERAALALSHSDTPPVRGFALLALANVRSKEVAERAGAVLEHDRNPWARGAAALALGHVGARDRAQALIAALTVESDEVSAAAALAIGMLGARDATRALAARVVSGEAWSSRASAWALAQLASPVPRATLELAAPIDRVALAPVLLAHLDSAPVARGALRAAAFDPLVVALRTALVGPLPTARAALRMLAQGSQELAGWDDQLTGDLASAVAPNLAALTVHRDAEARAVAFGLLLPLGPQRAFPALAAALAHEDAAVRSDALDALDAAPRSAFEAAAGDGPAAARGQAAVPEAFARALIALSHGDPQWTVRQRATQALGRLWAGAPSQNLLGQALTQALAADESAYVREAAATAFASARSPTDIPSASRTALERAAASDPETRVRNAATLALSLPFR